MDDIRAEGTSLDLGGAFRIVGKEDVRLQNQCFYAVALLDVPNKIFCIRLRNRFFVWQRTICTLSFHCSTLGIPILFEPMQSCVRIPILLAGLKL
jgi:hypothetical protein